MKTPQNISKYEKALKHITEIKEFYQHLMVYLVFVVLWLIFKENIVELVVSKTDNLDSGFLRWLRINITIIPILWGIGIFIHWLYLYKLKFSLFKKWEDKKIKEFMSKEKNDSKQNE